MPTAPAFVSVATHDDSGGTALTISKPSGLVSGHVMLAFCELNITAGAPLTLSPPAGWTTIYYSTAGNWVRAVFRRVAGSSEPSSYVFPTDSPGYGVTSLHGAILAYSGASTATPIDVSTVTSFGATSTPSAPGVTTLHDLCTVVHAWFAAGQFTSTPPSGETERVEQYTTASAPDATTLTITDKTAVTAGAVAAATATLSGTPTGGYAVTIALRSAELAPNAPTLTGPANGTVLDRTVTQRFTWTFDDPDPGDSQSGFELQYRTPAGSGSWTTVSATTPNAFYDFSPSALAAGDYEWQVRTKDSAGNFGAWSASGFVTLANVPTGPTITTPTSGGTLSLAVNTVGWSFSSQQAYQVRRVADVAGSPDTTQVLYDSGQITDTATRSVSVNFPTNNQYEHIQVRGKTGGLWSAWSSIRVHVSYTPPLAPTVDLTVYEPSAAIGIAITNPAPGGGDVPTAYNDLYRSDDGGATSIRIASMLAPNSAFTDFTPASGVDYTYDAVAVGDNGAEAHSGWSGAAGDAVGGPYGSGY